MSNGVCKKCGKSQSTTRAGSLTSFFFQHKYCQCIGLQAKGKNQEEPQSSICKSCGKARPGRESAGSFTSFLFQELRCKCPRHSTQTQSKSNSETRTPTAIRQAQRRQFTISRLNTLGDGAQTAFLPGETIAGTFLVNKQIGSGGMGVVYLVKHTALNKQFALKALAPDLVNEQNWLRFKAEAKTMASLNHRTFVNVYDESGLPIAKTVLIKEFIRQRTEPYSTPKTVAGEKVNVFNFPTNFSLGTIGFAKPGTRKWTMAPAQGAITAIYGKQVSITASQELLSYPELLKYFRNNELTVVNLSNSKVNPTKLLAELLKQKELNTLELKGTGLTDADLATIEKFQALISLDIGNTKITTAALAQCKVLTQLRSLQISMLSEVTPVLKVLVKGNNLTELNLSCAKLSTADYALISQMTNLKILSLKESAINDEDLLRLSSLPNLNTLYIDRCGNLTTTTIDTLKRFKSLRELRPPDQLEELFSDETLHEFSPICG